MCLPSIYGSLSPNISLFSAISRVAGAEVRTCEERGYSLASCASTTRELQDPKEGSYRLTYYVSVSIWTVILISEG